MNTSPKTRTLPGAVSMITVMLMSIILLVLVIGLVQIMVNEQRQSSDNELTNRAFYAAEAGLQSARQYVSTLSDADIESIASTSLAEADCLSSSDNLLGGIPSTLIADENYEAEIVCQKVSGIDGTYIIGSDIGVNSPRQYSLGTNKASVRIEWAIKGVADEELDFREDEDLPAVSEWDAPAALRLELFTFEPGVSRSDLLSAVTELYVLPAEDDEGSTTHSIISDNNSEPVLASCDSEVSTEQPMCSIVIEDLPANSNTTQYVRISFLYQADTAYITPLDPDGNRDDSLSGQLRVDTTGRVGDVFRRIQANVDVSNTLANNLPGYTLLSNQVCKTFEITDDVADFDRVNPAGITSDYCSN